MWNKNAQKVKTGKSALNIMKFGDWHRGKTKDKTQDWCRCSVGGGRDSTALTMNPTWPSRESLWVTFVEIRD